MTYSDVFFSTELILFWTPPTRGLLAAKGTFITLDFQVTPEKKFLPGVIIVSLTAIEGNWGINVQKSFRDEHLPKKTQLIITCVGTDVNKN